MDDSRAAYYRELQRDYERRIRQLAPGYDELVGVLVELVGLMEPSTVLDVGCGNGSLTQRILEALPEARLTALEPSPEMATEARRRLGETEGRGKVVESGILDFASPEGEGERADPDGGPAPRFGAVHSNLVLHNLPYPQKRRALERTLKLLEPGGAFVWGDLIRFSDPRLQELAVSRRIRHARAAGCSEELIEWNFRKEEEEDHPLTAEETLKLLQETGFADPDLVWARHAFLVARATRPR